MTNLSNPLDGLNFEAFRELARDSSLSRHERVGFPDSYREGKEHLILNDIISKLSALPKPSQKVLDIGSGSSNLPILLAHYLNERDSSLYLCDSPEMLGHLPSLDSVHLWPGQFPSNLQLDNHLNSFNAIIVYSVIQYVHSESNLWHFIDIALSLLAPAGELLLADIPNQSMRQRFFSSAAGIECHRNYTGDSQSLPELRYNCPTPGKINDAIVLAILSTVRSQGFHAWCLPQSRDLPMSNRREDILIRRP